MRIGRLSAFVLLAVCGVVCTIGGASRADERSSAVAGPFALELSGARCGNVRVVDKGQSQGQRQLSIIAQEVGPALASVVDGFAQGKPVKRDVRLTSGAMVRKAEGARLAAVKLPALGAGGSTDVALEFVTPAITTQPLLSAKEAPPPPVAARITSFRLAIAGMQAIDAAKLEAITLSAKSDGTTMPSELAIEVAAGGGPPFVAWQKAHAARPSARALQLEYIDSGGNPILKLQVGRCAPTEVRALGASGTTRIALSCAPIP